MSTELTPVEESFARLTREAGHAAAEPSREKTKLSGDQRRFLLVLALPTLGLSLSLTMASTYVPIFLQRLSGPFLTGVLVGSEGLFGLFVPILTGSWSDRIGSRFGGRLLFLLIAAPVGAVALVLMPLLGTLPALALLLPLFYIAYFTYYPPYRALYPDLVPGELRGRSQGIQKALREAGLGVALVGGGLLLSIWVALPFVVAAVVLLAVTAILYVRVSDPTAGEDDDGAPRPRALYGELRRLFRDEPPLRRLLIANSLWELALAALRSFVILFITVGLGRTTEMASGILAVAGVGVVAGALIAGKLADRIGHRRIVIAALAVYGLAALGPTITQSPWLLVVVVLAACAAGIVMALPYSMLMAMMPSSEHGVVSGTYEFSRGAGVMLGPLLAGTAVALLAPLFPLTKGYPAIFFVVSAAILASIPLIWRIPRSWTDPKKE
jgi:MFS family permease